MLTNADIGGLLWAAGRDEPGHRGRALVRASRAARFWPEEAHQLVDGGRSLTELRAVGPWVAAKIHGWLDDPPPVPEPEETRSGFLTYAEVRRTLNADPRWEADPCGDLQVHTTFSDGSQPLPRHGRGGQVARQVLRGDHRPLTDAHDRERHDLR